MKLLFLTDTHIRGNNPRGRTDHFPRTLISKLKEVASLAEEHSVHAVLHGGDLFDTPHPSISVSSEFLSVFKKMPAPVYVIAGNHDLYGQNPSTLPRTMLGLAGELGVFKVLEPGIPEYLTDGNVYVQLTGRHFHYDIDRRSAELDYAVSANNCDAAVHMVHGMLLERQIYPGSEHTLIENIADITDADFTLCGHAHLGFRDVKWNNKFFLNPGALVRISVFKEEIKRHPSVVIMDFTSQPPQYKKIRLKSVQPGEEVLDRSHIEKQEFQKEKLAMFIRGIQASGDYRITKIEEIIDKIAGREGLNDEVREEALKKLARVQEEMKE